MGSSHASGLDIIGHAEQVGLVARLLADPDNDEWDSNDDLAAPFYGSGQAFEGSWLSSGGSWGMPPTKEERGLEAARRRKESETRSVQFLQQLLQQLLQQHWRLVRKVEAVAWKPKQPFVLELAPVDKSLQAWVWCTFESKGAQDRISIS